MASAFQFQGLGVSSDGHWERWLKGGMSLPETGPSPVTHCPGAEGREHHPEGAPRSQACAFSLCTSFGLRTVWLHCPQVRRRCCWATPARDFGLLAAGPPEADWQGLSPRRDSSRSFSVWRKFVFCLFVCFLLIFQM